MLKRKKNLYNTTDLKDYTKVFNDGVIEVYQAQERKLIKLKGRFYFSNESIGESHFYDANYNGIKLDRAIGVIQNPNISQMDVVKIGNDFYKIAQIQYKDDRNPKYYKITLTRSNFAYDTN